MRYTELSKEEFSSSIKIYFSLALKVLILHLCITSNNGLTWNGWDLIIYDERFLFSGESFWINDPFNRTGLSVEGTSILKQVHLVVLHSSPETVSGNMPGLHMLI